MKIWRLKRGADRRVRAGHPWVFTSEIAHSTKEVSAGELVELRGHEDNFLAFGYAHPSAQICFRKLSGNAKETDVGSADFFVRRLRAARAHRQQAGWARFSHRWLYAEADGVPGLMVDAFLTSNQGWWVVVQASTAGAERLLPQVYEALKTFEHEFGLLTVIAAPSSKARAMEGLAVKEKHLVFGASDDLARATICLSGDLKLECDILHGQKTGFFLDQQWNTSLLRETLRTQFRGHEDPVRILDICSYVGQWAAQSAHALRGIEVPSDVTLMDVSSGALEWAQRNLRGLSDKVDAVCGDALDTLADLPSEHFDVVICDPPAFVKKKADLEPGLRAYVKLNREAIRRVKPGGLFVASSCSGLVKAGDWREVLQEAAQKSSRMLKQVLSGGHGPDHPLRPEFPEGEYLKCTIARVHYPY